MSKNIGFFFSKGEKSNPAARNFPFRINLRFKVICTILFWVEYRFLYCGNYVGKKKIFFLKTKERRFMSKLKKIGRSLLCLFALVAFSFPTYAAADNSVAAFSSVNDIETDFRQTVADADFPKEVVVGGETFGVKIKADGVLVVEMRDLETEDGKKVNPAYLSGIRPGDIITEIDGKKTGSASELKNTVSLSEGKEITLTVTRDGVSKKIAVTPQKDMSDGAYHIGIVVKDSTAGLGTITFYDAENKTFGALGHGICEGETSTLFPIAEADVFETRIYSVSKGAVGTPGELRGLFLDEKAVGSLFSNTHSGVFGTINNIPEKKKVKVAEKNEIREGKVTIVSTVDENGPAEYEAEITKIDFSGNGDKNFVVKITDPKLLEKTGGIVQGMSGSPILQNGKIIGAVTHVFINDPTSGYGIYIKNMPTA